MATTLIRDARVLDVHRGEYLENTDIVLDGATIVELGPGLAAGVEAHVIVDAGGRTVMPGLIDCHVHLAAASADLSLLPRTSASYVAAFAFRAMRRTVQRGFTTVRDQGGADHGFAEAQRDGLAPGPRIFYCGRALSQTGGHGDVRAAGEDVMSTCSCTPGMGRVVDGVAEARRAARDQLRKGASHIKVMASGGVASPTDRIDSLQFSVDELRAIVDEAASAHRYVAAHAYTAESIIRAVEAGIRTIEHGNLLDEATCRVMVEHAAYLVPTLVTYDRLAADGAAAGFPPASIDKIGTVLDKGLAAFDLAARSGVRIAYGSDLLGTMQGHQSREFRLRAEVATPLDIIRSATTTAAELLGQEGVLGEVSPGATADLIVVDGDPLADIDVLAEPDRHVRLVIQDGRIVHDARA